MLFKISETGKSSGQMILHFLMSRYHGKVHLFNLNKERQKERQMTVYNCNGVSANWN